MVKPLLVSKFLLESERRLRARSIQPKFRPVRPGKVAHLKRWTSFFETFPVGPNRYPLSFGWMDCALKFPEWYVLAGDLGFPLPPLPPPPPRFPPISRPTGWKTRNKTGTNSSLFLDPSPSRSSKLSEINHGGFVNVDEVLWNSRLTGKLVQHLLSCHETK